MLKLKRFDKNYEEGDISVMRKCSVERRLRGGLLRLWMKGERQEAFGMGRGSSIRYELSQKCIRLDTFWVGDGRMSVWKHRLKSDCVECGKQ